MYLYMEEGGVVLMIFVTEIGGTITSLDIRFVVRRDVLR